MNTSYEALIPSEARVLSAGLDVRAYGVRHASSVRAANMLIVTDAENLSQLQPGLAELRSQMSQPVYMMYIGSTDSKSNKWTGDMEPGVSLDKASLTSQQVSEALRRLGDIPTVGTVAQADSSSTAAQMDEHAGHDMAAMAHDEHAGHTMNNTESDPHAGHDMSGAAIMDHSKHGNHDMPTMGSADLHAGHDMSAMPGMDHSMHGGHDAHAGHSGHAGHGAGSFMSMVAMTAGQPRSRDGLIMESGEVLFGPFHPALAPGWQLSLVLDGDTVQSASATDLLGSDLKAKKGVTARAKESDVYDGLAWLLRLSEVIGWQQFGDAARRALMMLAGPDHDREFKKIMRKLHRQVRTNPFVRNRLQGLGMFEGHDVWSRLRAVTGGLVTGHVTLPSMASYTTELPKLLTGLELGDALIVTASFEPERAA